VGPIWEKNKKIKEQKKIKEGREVTFLSELGFDPGACETCEFL